MGVRLATDDQTLAGVLVRTPASRTVDAVCPICHQWLTSWGLNASGIRNCADTLRNHVVDYHEGPEQRQYDPEVNLRQFIPTDDGNSEIMIGTTSASRTCGQCGGAIPDRTARQRNAKGELVCDSCKKHPAPKWASTVAALTEEDTRELERRRAEAITSILRLRRAKVAAGGKCEATDCANPATHKVFGRGSGDDAFVVCDAHLDSAKSHLGPNAIVQPHPYPSLMASSAKVAHDSGDNAIINHCPFCGSGAVVGGSDGSVTCDFCHTPFTVQVQPAHPFMPQTIDGQPVTPPGMPGGVEQDMSAPLDPAVNETDEGVATDPLNDADPIGTNGPVAPGQPPSKQPENKPKPPGGDKPKGGGSKPPWLKNSSFHTAEGHTLDADSYMARLALEHADDRDAVLDAVRMTHQAAESAGEDCPTCDGHGEVQDGDNVDPLSGKPEVEECPTCKGSGVVDKTAKRTTGAKATKKVRASALTEGMSIGGARISRIESKDHYGAPGTMPWTIVTVYFEATPGGPSSGSYGSTEWVEVDRDTKTSKSVVPPFRSEAAVAKELIRMSITATEIEVGDRLDSSGKTRVAQRHPRTDKVLVKTQTTGARSPSVAQWANDETITVWRPTPVGE